MKRIMRFVAVRTIRTVFNPDLRVLEKGPLERLALQFLLSGA
jgi:hypothetical protein